MTRCGGRSARLTNDATGSVGWQLPESCLCCIMGTFHLERLQAEPYCSLLPQASLLQNRQPSQLLHSKSLLRVNLGLGNRFKRRLDVVLRQNQ